MLKVLSIALFALTLSAAAPAFARGGFHGGHGGFHSHVFFGFGCCGFGPYYPAYYPYYGYPYYPDPYAYPPPVPVPTPGAVYQYQAPAAYQAPAGNCRQFNGNATVDASGQPFHGTACLESDGRWHITSP